MTKEEFKEWVFKNNTDDYGVMSPPTEAQAGLNILIKHFLGDDWCAPAAIANVQVNTEAIYEIISKYPGVNEKLSVRISKWFKNKIK